MRRGVLLALALLAGLAAGCGSGGSSLLAASDASSLKATLDRVRDAVDARDVGACTARLRELRRKIGDLPPSVDRKLRVRLREEVTGKLGPRTTDECSAPKTTTEPTVTAPVTPGPTGPTKGTQTDTTPTETQPPTDTSTTPGTIPTPTDTGSVPADPTDPATPVDPSVPDPGGFGEDDG